MKKLTVIGGQVIVGVSGSVGVAQRYCESIEDAWKEANPSLVTKKPTKCADALSEAMRPHALLEMAAANQAASALGHSAFIQTATCAALIALPIRQAPRLIEFDEKCSSTFARPDLPFVAIGSGMHNAHAFLPFLRKLLVPDREPNIGEARALVYWTLRHAIEIDPGGVADPIEMYELRLGDAKDQWIVTAVDEKQRQELAQYVTETENKLKAAASPPATPPPTPPAPAT
jgi:20S proteasome alpha/beta subunit